jgi:hypothetical protein
MLTGKHGKEPMRSYVLKVYFGDRGAEHLWQTHELHAADDESAENLGRARFNELRDELSRAQAKPTLTRFSLYKCDRLVIERRT